MRYLCILAVVAFASSQAYGANLKDCTSYFLAPKGMKHATLGLISPETRLAKREHHKYQVRKYILNAPLASEDVVKYLKALRDDSPETKVEGIQDFAELMINGYLMRPGNEAFAANHLDDFLANYWLEFMFGSGTNSGETDRLKIGFETLEKQTEFLVRMAKSYPKQLQAAWGPALNEHYGEILSIRAVTASFGKSVTYLNFYKQQSDDEVAEDDQLVEDQDDTDSVLSERRRLSYVRELIKELDHVPPANDFPSLMKLYQVGDQPFSGNRIFEEDETKWAGSEIRFISATQTLVFLFRLSRYIGVQDGRMKEVENRIHYLKELLPAYPRPKREPTVGRWRG